MSPHPSPSGGSPEGTPPSAPDLDEALRAIRSLAAAQHEVFGPWGQIAVRFVFFLARTVRDRLVALKRNRIGRDPNSRTADLRVIDQLDSSVPPPADSCPVCQTPFASWDPACPECGADVAGAAGVPGLGTNRDQLLEAIRESAPGYEVLGEMPRAAGGGLVTRPRSGWRPSRRVATGPRECPGPGARLHGGGHADDEAQVALWNSRR